MFETWVRAVRSVMPEVRRRSPGWTGRGRPAPRTSRSRAVSGRCRRPSPAPPGRPAPVRIRRATIPATAGSRWTSPACAARIAAATSSASASLSRKPVAPASSAAMTRASSMKLVSATTSIAGWAALMRGRRRDPVDAGHQQVHHDDVGPELGGRARRPGAVVGLADDLDVVVQLEEVAHARDGPSRGRRRAGRGCGASSAPDRIAGRRPWTARARRPARRLVARRDAAQSTAADRWRSSAAPRIADRADDLDRGEPLGQQPGRQRDADDRLEQHQDPGPRPADQPDPGQEQRATGWPPRRAR